VKRNQQRDAKDAEKRREMFIDFSVWVRVWIVATAIIVLCVSALWTILDSSYSILLFITASLC
jgi:hypothetical protein